MLRITTQNDGVTTVFDLEGKLAGPWVDELERCWQQAVINHRPVRVVLKTVAFIDAEGRRLLADMYRQGVELAAEGCMTKAVVEGIKRGGEC
jgi:hypothetical protein